MKLIHFHNDQSEYIVLLDEQTKSVRIAVEDMVTDYGLEDHEIDVYPFEGRTTLPTDRLLVPE